MYIIRSRQVLRWKRAEVTECNRRSAAKWTTADFHKHSHQQEEKGGQSETRWMRCQWTRAHCATLTAAARVRGLCTIHVSQCHDIGAQPQQQQPCSQACINNMSSARPFARSLSVWVSTDCQAQHVRDARTVGRPAATLYADRRTMGGRPGCTGTPCVRRKRATLASWRRASADQASDKCAIVRGAFPPRRL